MAMTERAGAPETADRRTIVGVFEDPDHAESALNDLRDTGFAPEQVSVVARDTRAGREMAENTGMAAETAGAGTGAFLGGVTGGIVGWLIGIGALAIPGIGPVVAAGALATTLGGAAIGALAGGMVGGLVAMGIPEEEARGYEASVHAGRILLMVTAQNESQSQQARDIFGRHHGADVRAYDLAEGGDRGQNPA